MWIFEDIIKETRVLQESCKTPDKKLIIEIEIKIAVTLDFQMFDSRFVLNPSLYYYYYFLHFLNN